MIRVTLDPVLTEVEPDKAVESEGLFLVQVATQVVVNLVRVTAGMGGGHSGGG